MVHLGDTFFLQNKEIEKHLHIVISDPVQDSERIVTANFTTYRADKDQSCIVEKGDHPFIQHRSCIHYRQDRLITVAQFEQVLKAGAVVPQDPVSKELLERILQGAAVSPFLPLINRQILREQGLIDGTSG